MHDGLKLVAELQLQSPPIEYNTSRTTDIKSYGY